MLSYARRVVVASALLALFRLLPGVLSSRIGAAFQQAEHAAEGFIHQKLHHGPAYGLHAADVAGQQPATAVEVVPFPQAGDAKLVPSFFNSLCMILVTEIGDETFIIAALMAMRHPRLPVFGGAMSALALMTIISTGMGFLAPYLITRKATSRVATGLYTFFGLRLFYLAYKADPNGTAEDEIEEVEQKLSSGGAKKHGRLGRVVARFCTPIFLEAFILTFLAEWGDRSQIATITLASHMNPLCVTVGAIVGHCICTGTAVTGGELLAKRISQRTVAVMAARTSSREAAANVMLRVDDATAETGSSGTVSAGVQNE